MGTPFNLSNNQGQALPAQFAYVYFSQQFGFNVLFTGISASNVYTVSSMLVNLHYKLV